MLLHAERITGLGRQRAVCIRQLASSRVAQRASHSSDGHRELGAGERPDRTGTVCTPAMAHAGKQPTSNITCPICQRSEAMALDDGRTLVHMTDLKRVYLDTEGYISRCAYDPWQGTWRWTCEKALPRVDDDGNSSVQVGPRVIRLERARGLVSEGTRPLPKRLLALETLLHKHRAHTVEALQQHVTYSRGTLLSYLGALVHERPYGETTRLVARMLPNELLKELYRVPPGLLCGRLAPLMHVLDGALGEAWRREPHRYALVRLAREYRRKKRVQRHVSPSEKGVVDGRIGA